MKLYSFCLPVLFLPAFTTPALAQKNKNKEEKIVLVCPFEHGSGREPKEAFTWDPPDQKVIMISHVDSIIRSCINGEVLNVSNTDDGRFEIVIGYRDYYFWYYNVEKALVNTRQSVKAGQTIGIYKFGDELEFRMFKEMKDTEPQMMDPRELLECKIPKADD